jgi:BioD-like phosphotransacetylase family protein
VLVTEEFKKKAFSGKYGECLADINQAYNRLAEDRDLMLVAGSGSMHAGRYCQVDGVTVSQSLGSKVVVIDRFQKELQYDFLLVLKEMLGDDLAGVILNAVPASFMEELRYQITPFLESKGVKMLGVLPQDPVLGSIKVRDLAGRIDGKQLEPGGEDRIVENFLIGTMQVENFLTHFKKTRNAAVIVGGDRSDVQLVALEGNCACLVLTGNLYPNDIIQTRAEVLEIPLIMVREDTYTVAKKMEHVIATHKLRDEVKYKEAAQLVGNRLDMEHLRQVLGV